LRGEAADRDKLAAPGFWFSWAVLLFGLSTGPIKWLGQEKWPSDIFYKFFYAREYILPKQMDCVSGISASLIVLFKDAAASAVCDELPKIHVRK